MSSRRNKVKEVYRQIFQETKIIPSNKTVRPLKNLWKIALKPRKENYQDLGRLPPLKVKK